MAEFAPDYFLQNVPALFRVTELLLHPQPEAAYVDVLDCASAGAWRSQRFVNFGLPLQTDSALAALD